MSIYSKLLNIQTKLKAPKNQRNNFGKYNYRSCEDILESVKPLCLKESVTLTLSDELVLIGERYYIKATAKLTDDKESVEVTAYAREEETKKGMDGSQITGASSSYARKYALNGLFDIDDTKDSDTTNTRGKRSQQGPTLKSITPVPSKEQQAEQNVENKIIDKTKLATLESTLKEKRVPAKQLLGRYKVKALANMTLMQWTDAMNLLSKVKSQKKVDLGL